MNLIFLPPCSRERFYCYESPRKSQLFGTLCGVHTINVEGCNFKKKKNTICSASHESFLNRTLLLKSNIVRFRKRKMGFLKPRFVCISTTDESEPSWLELNNFQLGSAQLVTFSIQLGKFPIKARKLPY